MVLRNQADDRRKRRPITFSAGDGRGSAALTARREGTIMMYAEYEMAAVLVLLVGAGCEVMATRLRRAHPARMPDRQAAPPLSIEELDLRSGACPCCTWRGGRG